MKKNTIVVILCVWSSYSVNAQTGAISGKITDNNDKQPVENAIVVVSKNNVPVGGTTTDKEGNYTVKPVPVGNYEVKARRSDYIAHMIPYVQVAADKATPLNFTLNKRPKPQH